MPLAAPLDYRTFPLPVSLDPEAALEIPSLEETIKQQSSRLSGECVILPKKDIPSWYYLLAFKHLYASAPEIAIELRPDFYLILHSLYRNDALLRPETVHLFLELLEEPLAPEDEIAAEIQLDLTMIQAVDPSNLKKVIGDIKKQARFTKRLLLQGETDPATALICYCLWRRYADEILYQYAGNIISLS